MIPVKHARSRISAAISPLWQTARFNSRDLDEHPSRSPRAESPVERNAAAAPVG
jgi:hypothetical protein